MQVLASHDTNGIRIESLHLLVQDNENEIQHDFFRNLTLSTMALGII